MIMMMVTIAAGMRPRWMRVARAVTPMTPTRKSIPLDFHAVFPSTDIRTNDAVILSNTAEDVTIIICRAGVHVAADGSILGMTWLMRPFPNANAAIEMMTMAKMFPLVIKWENRTHSATTKTGGARIATPATTAMVAAMLMIVLVCIAMDDTFYVCIVQKRKMPGNYVYRQGRDGATIVDGDTGKSLVKKATMLSTRDNTASGADAVHFSLKDGSFMVVKVIHKQDAGNSRGNTNQTKELRGLQHEKRVYTVLNVLVELRVCPFFVRRIELKDEPDNLLATSSFGIRRFMFMSKYLKRVDLRPKSDDDAVALVLNLLYALEVLWRVGIRHNDMHTKNILMVATPPSMLGGYRRFEYLPRDSTAYTTFDIPVMRYEPMIFDVDRAFKFEPSNSRVRIGTGSMNTSPVTDRWWWHDPAHGVGSFDMHKVLQQLRHGAGEGTPLRRVLETCYTLSNKKGVCLSLPRSRYSESTNSLNMSWINKYMIPVNRTTNKEIVPKSVWHQSATPDFFITRLSSRFKKGVSPRPRIVDTATMRPLYQHN